MYELNGMSTIYSLYDAMYYTCTTSNVKDVIMHGFSSVGISHPVSFQVLKYAVLVLLCPEIVLICLLTYSSDIFTSING